MNKHAPFLEQDVKKKRNDFTTPEIITLRRKRRKAERDYRRSIRSEDLNDFYNLKKSVSKAVKKSRTQFYSSKLSKSKGKQKETYQTFNKLLGKQNGKRSLPEHSNEKDLANLFKTFFYEQIEKARNSISEQLAQYKIIL